MCPHPSLLRNLQCTNRAWFSDACVLQRAPGEGGPQSRIFDDFRSCSEHAPSDGQVNACIPRPTPCPALGGTFCSCPGVRSAWRHSVPLAAEEAMLLGAVRVKPLFQQTIRHGLTKIGVTSRNGDPVQERPSKHKQPDKNTNCPEKIGIASRGQLWQPDDVFFVKYLEVRRFFHGVDRLLSPCSVVLLKLAICAARCGARLRPSP